MKIVSLDGSELYYEFTPGERGQPVLLFVHGWLGNCRWFDGQRDFVLGKGYGFAAMDLPGHGLSSPAREYTSTVYAAAIRAVVMALPVDKVVLVGHSMSGAYALEAGGLSKVSRIVLVDTLKNLEQKMSAEQVETFFAGYREDFAKAVREVLPHYLFAAGTPGEVRSRLEKEFLASPAKKRCNCWNLFIKWT